MPLARYIRGLGLAFLAAALCSLPSCGPAAADHDPLEGKWMWTEMHADGMTCIGDADLFSDGTMTYEEYCQRDGQVLPIFRSWERGVSMWWQRTSAQTGVVTVDNNGDRGAYAVMIAQGQDRLTFARFGGNDNNMVSAVKTSGDGIIPTLTKLYSEAEK